MGCIGDYEVIDRTFAVTKIETASGSWVQDPTTVTLEAPEGKVILGYWFYDITSGESFVSPDGSSVTLQDFTMYVPTNPHTTPTGPIDRDGYSTVYGTFRATVARMGG